MLASINHYPVDPVEAIAESVATQVGIANAGCVATHQHEATIEALTELASAARSVAAAVTAVKLVASMPLVARNAPTQAPRSLLLSPKPPVFGKA